MIGKKLPGRDLDADDVKEPDRGEYGAGYAAKIRYRESLALAIRASFFCGHPGGAIAGHFGGC
jgi:hypothetical protein